MAALQYPKGNADTTTIIKHLWQILDMTICIRQVEICIALEMGPDLYGTNQQTRRMDA